ncbi:Mor transcription activator family protein [Chloroflexota bacterium]
MIARFRRLPKPLHASLTARERNTTIRARFAAGESQADLARDFGISYQRVHQIVNKKHH